MLPDGMPFRPHSPAFVWLLSGIIPRLGLTLSLEISQASLLKVGGTSLVIAALSAILPIRQIAGLDPAIVFRPSRCCAGK